MKFRHVGKLFLVFVGLHLACDFTWFMVGRETDFPMWASASLIVVVSGVITFIAERQERWG